MKLILTLAFASSIFIGNSQTPLIAHKSHSGTLSSYTLATSSNFGAIEMKFDPQSQPPQLYKSENFKALNDSVIVFQVLDNQKVIRVDTLSNQNRYSTVLFEYQYKDSIRKKEQEEIYKLESQQRELLEKQQLESQKQIKEESTPVKKKKKSYLLFLFGITGGGMLLMRLFSRSKIIKSIA